MLTWAGVLVSSRSPQAAKAVKEAATTADQLVRDEPRFVGRDAELRRAIDLAHARPGLLVVAGAPKVGTSRFAAELAAALGADGALAVRLRGGGTVTDRLSAGLVAADLRPEPVQASRLRPFVAIANDIDAAQEAVAAIGDSLVGTPGLLIATAHEDTDGAGTQLDPLDEDAMLSIAREVAECDAHTLAEGLHLAGGRPGVLIPVLRANRTREPDAPIRLPALLMRDVEKALRHLTPVGRDIASWTAVIRGEVTVGELVPVTGRHADGLEPLLDELIAQGILREVSGPGPVRFAFVDPFLAEAVYQQIPSSDRRRRNGAVLAARRAAGNGPEELVRFAVGSARARDVIGTSLRAAALARGAGDAKRAREHATRAIAWSEADGDAASLLDAQLEEGLAMATLGEWGPAGEILEAVTHEQRRRGNVAGTLSATTEWARLRWYAGDYSAAVSLLAVPELIGGEPLPERAEALDLAAMFAVQSGRNSEAILWAQRSRDEARACGATLTLTRTLSTLGLARVHATGSPDGIEDIRESFREAAALGNHRQQVVALNNQAVALNALGMPLAAVDRAHEGLAIAAERGVAELDAPLNHNLAEALAGCGRLREASQAAQKAEAAFAALGPRVSHTDVTHAWLEAAVGNIDASLAAFAEIGRTTDIDGMTIEDVGPLAAAHITVARLANEIEKSRDAARHALALWRETEDRADSIILLAAAAAALPADEAREVLDELRVSATAGSPGAQAFVLYVTACHASTPGEAVSGYREASEAFAATGLRWWAALSLLHAGELSGADGAEDLQVARNHFREMEAPGWRARCEAGLRAIGHRFVTPSPNTPDAALSQREREVLLELGQGMSNKEIGQRLFISEKTVGHHLGRVFAKLGVSGRTAAVTAARDRGLLDELTTDAPDVPSTRRDLL